MAIDLRPVASFTRRLPSEGSKNPSSPYGSLRSASSSTTSTLASFSRAGSSGYLDLELHNEPQEFTDLEDNEGIYHNMVQPSVDQSQETVTVIDPHGKPVIYDLGKQANGMDLEDGMDLESLYEAISLPKGYLLVEPSTTESRQSSSSPGPAVPPRNGSITSSTRSAGSTGSTHGSQVIFDAADEKAKELTSGTTFHRIALDIPGVAHGGKAAKKINEKFEFIKSRGANSPQEIEFCRIYNEMALGNLSKLDISTRNTIVAVRLLLSEAGTDVLDGVFTKDGLTGKDPKQKIWDSFTHSATRELEYVLKDTSKRKIGISLNTKEQKKLTKDIQELAQYLFYSDLKAPVETHIAMEQAIKAAEFMERCAEMINKGNTALVQTLLKKAEAEKSAGTPRNTASSLLSTLMKSHPDFFKKSTFDADGQGVGFTSIHRTMSTQSLRVNPLTTSFGSQPSRTSSMRSRLSALSHASWHGPSRGSSTQTVTTSSSGELASTRQQKIRDLFEIDNITEAEQKEILTSLHMCLGRLKAQESDYIFSTILTGRDEEIEGSPDQKQRQRFELYDYLEGRHSTQVRATADRAKYPQYLGEPTKAPAVPPRRISEESTVSANDLELLFNPDGGYEAPLTGGENPYSVGDENASAGGGEGRLYELAGHQTVNEELRSDADAAADPKYELAAQRPVSGDPDNGDAYHYYALATPSREEQDQPSAPEAGKQSSVHISDRPAHIRRLIQFMIKGNESLELINSHLKFHEQGPISPDDYDALMKEKE